MNTKYTNRVSRREFLSFAAALGAAAAWATPSFSRSNIVARERRDLFPEGVASGDPEARSVILWTRRPFTQLSRQSEGVVGHLRVEVSEDETFTRVIAKARVAALPSADWTCRVLVGNLKPSRVYWYRFIDEQGNSSRVGRTITAPAENDARSIRFAVVSCQNANLGEQHAYRRMIFEDERAAAPNRLGFVLHLGDFIYEIVWYPEDRPQGMYGRRFRDIVRYPHGENIADYHIPATLEDYRAIYRAYLHDPHLQDARARWPFVCMWDNHEFSIYGWQSIQIFNGQNRPAQTRKVAANQAWFEYQPSRAVKLSGPSLDQFSPPAVQDAPIREFDDSGLGDEPNNRIALASLTGYRALRWGRNVELIITDQRSYRSEEPSGRPEAKALTSEDFPELIPQEAMEILDAGRNYAGGKPPDILRIGDGGIPNFRKNDPPQSILGAEQKKWFLQRLKDSKATWKIWGNTLGTLDYRADPQNLPVGLTKPWPGAGYAAFRGGDASTAYAERAEIYSFVRERNITGFVTVAGDRHSFWAGLAASSLPPRPFEPVGVAFVTGSISAPGLAEKLGQNMTQDHPLHALYMLKRSPNSGPEATVNLLVRHGVRSCLEYQRTGDLERARSLSNPDLSPHLTFLDLGGNGYMTVNATTDAVDVEFVCIPHPVDRIDRPDGGPLLYRVVHHTPQWAPGEKPRLEQHVLEGNPEMSL